MDASGIAVADLRDEYRRRGVDRWSDLQLVRAVADVVCRPRSDPASSFVLHAPLELAARAALLPRVDGPARELARLHVLAVAAQYEEFGPPAELASPAAELPVSADPSAWLADAIAAGDLEEADRAASAVADRSRPHELAPRLADLLVPLTSAAAHAPIFLFQFGRIGPRSELPARLLRPLARELARNPGWRLRWIDAHRPSGPTHAGALTEALARTPALGVPGSRSIHPIMMQVDEGGVAAEQLGSVLGRYDGTAARALLRVAARSMLEDSPVHAPYGWSHCLTMPQAVIGIARQSRDPDRCLAVAATHVAGFRAALGSGPLADGASGDTPRPGTVRPSPGAVDEDALATAAATSHDAHVLKYALACLDAAAWDPPARHLFLAAGQRLLDVWRDSGGDPSDPLA